MSAAVLCPWTKRLQAMPVKVFPTCPHMHMSKSAPLKARNTETITWSSRE